MKRMYDVGEMVLAIDPGTTTGVAWRDGSGCFGSLEIRGRYEFEEWVALALLDPVPVTVVIERWDVRRDTRSKSNQDDPRYIIGYVDGICNALAHVTYVEQTPAVAKSFATDDKLRALGWFRGGEGHADDAARHLLVRLANVRDRSVLEVLL